MGLMLYGGNRYSFEDRQLAHIKVALQRKLRKQECFLMSWTVEPSDGSGRVSLWMSPAIPLAFHFSGSRQPVLNEEWLAVLEHTSHSPRGLVLIPEQDAEALAQKLKKKSQQGITQA
ncbi:DUF7882 family protein [Leucobacter sp. VD1]|uniref:DUF7882 family protein n=1 Tax=Leucobacter sp. VD1 TaxID=3080381 RepID=UPI0030177E0A